MNDMTDRIDLDELVKGLPGLVPAGDAASFLHVSRDTIRRWAAAGRITTLRTDPGRGRKVLVPKQEVRRVLAEMLSTARSALLD